MFLLAAVTVTITIVLATLSRGRSAGLCACWGLIFLVPTWMQRKQGALIITPRMLAVTVVVGCLFLFADRLRIRKRLVFLDLLVVLITAAEIVGGYYSRDFTITLAAQSVATWCTPYIFGRLLANPGVDKRSVISVACCVATMLAVWGITESIIDMNPVDLALGRPDYGGSYRWGLRRAAGPVDHPIHFGNVMLMLLPWAFEAGRRSWFGSGPGWWKWMPVVAVAGLCSALSRGPVMGICILAGVLSFLRFPQSRSTIICVSVLGMGLIAANFGAIVDGLSKSSGEQSQYGSYMVSIEGKEYPYTGTNHRLLQFLVFRRALEDAGYFGYGTWGLDPKHLTYVEPPLRAKFWSIDNHYILQTLTSGYVGLSMWFALGTTAAVYTIRLSQFGRQDRLLAASMCGAIIASLLLLWSVWFSPDFSFIWLTSIGIVGSWWANEASSDFEEEYPLDDFSNGEFETISELKQEVCHA